MKVHVIIPAWNCEKYISACLDSLLRQTYKDVEIVVVNDGSTDNTPNILQQYSAKHKQITLLSQNNAGPSAARNAGLDYLQSKNIAQDDGVVFVDADDWVEPDFVAALAQLVNEKGCQFGACAYKWQKPTDKRFAQKPAKIQSLTKEQALSQIFVDKIWVSLWNKIFVWKHIGSMRFDTSLWIGEDIVFLFNYLFRLPAESKAAFTNQKLYHYIKRSSSLSSFSFHPRKLNILIEYKKMRQQLVQSNMLSVVPYLEAWDFLIRVEYLLYTRKGEYKYLHSDLKRQARQFLKSYKKIRRQYSLFRRYANLIFWAI